MFYVNGWCITLDQRPYGVGTRSGWRAARNGVHRGAPSPAVLQRICRRDGAAYPVVFQLRLQWKEAA